MDASCLEDGSLEREAARERFLSRARALERDMEAAEAALARRALAMQRILALRDPGEQLAEYVALRLGRQHDVDASSAVARELLECAGRLADEHDRELATLAAFVFLGDASGSAPRGLSSLFPVVESMARASSAMDQAPF